MARDAERARNFAFAANLRRLMCEHGLTTRDLGSAIGMSHQGISQWLSAQNGPSNRRLAQLANFFGVSVGRFLSAPVGDQEPVVGAFEYACWYGADQGG